MPLSSINDCDVAISEWLSHFLEAIEDLVRDADTRRAYAVLALSVSIMMKEMGGCEPAPMTRTLNLSLLVDASVLVHLRPSGRSRRAGGRILQNTNKEKRWKEATWFKQKS